MVFNATLNNISVISLWSVLLVEETRVLGENYRPVSSHYQNCSHNVVSSTPLHERDSNSLLYLVVICTNCIGICKSNYHMLYESGVKYPQYINHSRYINYIK
jgi:hypothetical protein